MTYASFKKLSALNDYIQVDIPIRKGIFSLLIQKSSTKDIRLHVWHAVSFCFIIWWTFLLLMNEVLAYEITNKYRRTSDTVPFNFKKIPIVSSIFTILLSFFLLLFDFLFFFVINFFDIMCKNNHSWNKQVHTMPSNAWSQHDSLRQ